MSRSSLSVLPLRRTSQETWRSTSVFCVYFIGNILNWNMSAHATSICANFATARGQEFQIGVDWNAPTQNLVAFYRALLAEGKLGEADLLKMRERLLRGELVNPFPRIGSTATENEQFLKLAQGLSTPQVNIAHVLLWVKAELDAHIGDQKKRDERKEETRHPFKEMKLDRIQSGTFLMGETRPKITTLSHSVASMTTPVTQWMWVKEFGVNPSNFKDGEHTVEVVINGRAVRMQPDNPVENITWWSMIVFANRLSKRFGLDPAYNLNRIEFGPNTSAEQGTLVPTSGRISNRMIVNHPSGSIYKTRGFRLLTEAEWELLATARSTVLGHLATGRDDGSLDTRAWYGKNSRDTTHPVGSLDGLKVGDFVFYDLIGNVWEWVWDFNSELLSGGPDPEGPAYGEFRMIRGGGYGDDISNCSATFPCQYNPNAKNPDIGFRLGLTVQ